MRQQRRARSQVSIAIVGVALTMALLAAGASAASAPQWIVFAAHPKKSTAVPQLFRIASDGSGLRQLTKGSIPAVAPSFSPDGTQIVFTRLGQGLVTMAADGSGQKPLTRNGRDSYGVWSPDGKTIAFVRPYKTEWRLFTVSPSGSNVKLLSKSPPSGRPSWTSDSKSLIIPSGGAMVKVNATTGSPRSYYNIALDGQVSQTAAVSPNARMVAYVNPRVPTGPEDCGEWMCPQYGIYVANVPRPHKPRRLVNDAGAAGWSHDSKHFAFFAGGKLQIWTAAKKRVKLIDTAPHVALGDAPPAWRPR